MQYLAAKVPSARPACPFNEMQATAALYTLLVGYPVYRLHGIGHDVPKEIFKELQGSTFS